MWVDDKLVDDGFISICMMSIHEIHVFELRIETNFQCTIFPVMRVTHMYM